jgi:hypothetical protein
MIKIKTKKRLIKNKLKVITIIKTIMMIKIKINKRNKSTKKTIILKMIRKTRRVKKR